MLLLVAVFRWGVGSDLAGLYQFSQVEGWIPIFLFAMLFGLSMDYEVFLVSRMREAWWLPGWIARVARVKPSPLVDPSPALRATGK